MLASFAFLEACHGVGLAVLLCGGFCSITDADATLSHNLNASMTEEVTPLDAPSASRPPAVNEAETAMPWQIADTAASK